MKTMTSTLATLVLLLATLVLPALHPGTLSAQTGQPAADTIPEYLWQAIGHINSPEAMPSIKAKGEKHYQQIWQFAKQEKYREAIDVYEQNKGNIHVYLGNTTAIFEFGMQIVNDIYAKVLDEEAINAKAIEILSLNDALMECVIAMNGNIPALYLSNKNNLAACYYRQGDYKEALAQMTAIFDVMCSQGDTTSADYALITANLGICTMDMFLNEYPPIEQASPAQKDTIIMLASISEYLFSRASELYNNLDMRHSMDNRNALLHVLDIEETFFKCDSVIIPCIEQILEIHAVNDWPLDQRVSLARTHLLILYLANGLDDKATRLHAQIQAASDDPIPSLDELRARLSSPD